jgi:hypothetical protein
MAQLANSPARPSYCSGPRPLQAQPRARRVGPSGAAVRLVPDPVKIHQSIIEQASLPKDNNPITNDNHQNMTPPPFDKEKLSAMQIQVL